MIYISFVPIFPNYLNKFYTIGWYIFRLRFYVQAEHRVPLRCIPRTFDYETFIPANFNFFLAPGLCSFCLRHIQLLRFTIEYCMYSMTPPPQLATCLRRGCPIPPADQISFQNFLPGINFSRISSFSTVFCPKYYSHKNGATCPVHSDHSSIHMV
jgi:hypothetical protein